MKRGIVVACLIGLVAALGVQAEETNSPTPPKPPMHRPIGPMMDNLLPPRALEDLALTADQKAKYDVLAADFKKDAAKWRADNNYDPEKAHEEMLKARAANDEATIKKLADQRKGLMDIRKGYADKVRALLTDEQKAKLSRPLERGPGGPRNGETTPPPAVVPAVK
jgi:Spy/CpxP family protein refolding chaperone